MLTTLFMIMALDPKVTEVFNYFATLEDQGNGVYVHNHYNTRTFSMDKRVAALLKANQYELGQGSDCERTITVGVATAISDLKNSKWFIQTQDVTKLQGLQRAGKLKAAVTNRWDGVSGDAAHCAVEDYYFFSKDGQELILNVDATQD